MEWFKADLHTHTVLSPCGSLDMSPVKIVEAALNKGIQLLGISDHNSTLQCEEIVKVAQKKGLAIVCGAEVTTREEVHCLAFFENFEILALFQAYLDAYLPNIKNDEEKFGDQVWVNEAEEILGQEDRLLLSAIDQSIDEVEIKVHELGGLFILAHVDRKSFSIYSQLGFVPLSLNIDAIELSDNVDYEAFVQRHSELKNYTVIRCSDAHYPDKVGTSYSLVKMELPTFEELKKAFAKQDGRDVLSKW